MKTKLTNCVKTVLLSFMLGVLFACCQGAASSGNAGKNASRVRIASNDSAKLVPDKALNDASCVLAGLPVDKASGKLYALTRNGRTMPVTWIRYGMFSGRRLPGW